MSSSPWERLWNGDEDVATPFHAEEVSRCARHGVVILHRRKFPVRFVRRRVL